LNALATTCNATAALLTVVSVFLGAEPTQPPVPARETPAVAELSRPGCGAGYMPRKPIEVSQSITRQLPVKNDWRETQWSAHLAKSVNGQPEFRLPDGSRIDILTDKTAWEVEWADKWPEAIGQAAFYGISTDRKPGVWLLVKPGDDERYLRCLLVCRKYGIELRTQKVR